MNRDRIAALVAGAAALVGLALVWHGHPSAPAPVVLPEPFAAVERPVPPLPPGVEVTPPAFDIVRIDPTGRGAASGRAVASSQITMFVDGRPTTETRADDRGEWVLLLSPPLKGPHHVLAVRARLPAGGGVVSRETVVVSFSEQKTERPLAVRVAPKAPSLVLQTAGGPNVRSLSLDTIDLEGETPARIGGRAEPDRLLNVYFDDRFAGATEADGEGRWTFSVPEAFALEAGSHRVRLDVIGEEGAVTQRLAIPCNLEGPGAVPDTGGEALLVEATSLSWRIVQMSPEGVRRTTFVFPPEAGTLLDTGVRYPGQVAAPAVSLSPVSAGP